MTASAVPEILDRRAILPDARLPDFAALIDEGRSLARTVRVGPCPFLAVHQVASEAEFKRRRMAEGRIMLHGQIGFRDPDKSRRAYAEIWESIGRAGYAIDRYGICLDWSMGYPRARRGALGRGTGMILDTPEDFARLTAMAPVAPHFGDFVLGTPAALENTTAALLAGATTIGNLGQYFTFRMPEETDDVAITAETVKAMALIGAQREHGAECVVHSNLDDGFAALFTDLSCALGAILIEKRIVEDQIGVRLVHCYGNTFIDPLKRMAFLFALARVQSGPGSMVYGNTTGYGDDPRANWGSLAAYFLPDIAAQRHRPTGHALNPVPITEAQRIPDIDEIVEAHLTANRLIERFDGLMPLLDPAPARDTADAILAAGERFRDRVLEGLDAAGIDTGNPLELLLAIRRLGAKRLEEMFGPGAPDPRQLRGRRAVVAAPTIAALDADGARRVGALEPALIDRLAASGLRGVVVATDVHEYGKILVEGMLERVGLGAVDGGTHGPPADVARRAAESGAAFIAVSTYNGVALDYLTRLKHELDALGLDMPIYIGGKLNQVPDRSNTSLPVDVSAQLRAAGAMVCSTPEDMLRALGELAAGRPAGSQSGRNRKLRT